MTAEPRRIKLADCTPDQRRLILALIALKRATDEAKRQAA